LFNKQTTQLTTQLTT